MTTETRFPVGHLVRNSDEANTLPVGTTIGPPSHPNETYTRREDGWWDNDQNRPYGGGFASNFNRIISYSETEGHDPMTVTAEEFASMAVGQSVYITVGSEVNRWTRVDGGWSLAGTTPIEASCFTSSVEAGQVRRSAELRMNQWWRSDYYFFRIRAIDGEGVTPVITDTFEHEGRYMGVNEYRADARLGELADPPEWARFVEPLINQIAREKQRTATAIRQRDRYRDDRTAQDQAHSERIREIQRDHNASLERLHAAHARELEQARVNVPVPAANAAVPAAPAVDMNALQEALHEYLSDQSGLTGDEREALVELMESHGMEAPPPEEVSIDLTIEVEGVTEHEIDDETAFSIVGSRSIYHPSDEDVTISWNRQFDISREGPRGRCVCDQIDRDDVAALLSDDSITYTSFDYEVSCDND
jgi:hypothetical protein